MKLAQTFASLILSSSVAISAARAGTIVETHAGAGGEQLGFSIDSVGDQDGDGIADIIIGAPNMSHARLYSGKTGAAFFWWGGALGPGFGRVVAGVGDVNGDGFDDIAVSFLHDTRAVYAYSGASKGTFAVLGDPGMGEQFGNVLRGVGDIDGDGCAEIAIGAPQYKVDDPKPGHVYIYSVAKEQYLRILTPLTQNIASFGTSIANAGDVNGDGVDDMLVGAPSNGESAHLYSGFTGLPLRTFTCPVPFASFGTSVVGLGPIGDGGHALVAIGSPEENSSAGAVRVFDAVDGALLHTFTGETGSRFGATLATTIGVHDMTGYRSLIVGAPESSGAVYVFDMPTGALLQKLDGLIPGARFGDAIAGLGSRDGDKYGEFAIGAWNSGGGSGAAYIVKGIAPCGPITSYGTGCPGMFGFAPKLAVEGCARAQVASGITLTIKNGPPAATTALLCVGAGAGQLNIVPSCALYFGQIVGSPIVLPLTPTPGGALGPIPLAGITVAATVPALGVGFDLPLQAIVIDAATQNGFSTTNAVKVSFLP